MKCDKCGSESTELIEVKHKGSGKIYNVVCLDCNNTNSAKVFKGKSR